MRLKKKKIGLKHYTFLVLGEKVLFSEIVLFDGTFMDKFSLSFWIPFGQKETPNEKGNGHWCG
jgi:hypothetical protein